MGIDDEKRLAAGAAAALAENGMAIGLGTGTTVAHFLSALAARGLDVVCVATSPGTEQAARELGLRLDPFDELDRLDLAVDGADQVAPDGWLVKGGGGAQTREKIVATAAERFVVIVSSDKLVERIGPPIPVELAPFGLAATMRLIGAVELRAAPRTPDGGILADLVGPVGELDRAAEELDAFAGVIGHGLFPPSLVSEILVGTGDSVERRAP